MKVAFAAFAAFTLGGFANLQTQEPPVHVVFMEPEGALDGGKPPLYRVVQDPTRVKTYRGWMNNEPARMATALYGRAWRQVRDAGTEPVFYVALIPGGNHADAGFRLRLASGIDDHPRESYLKLNPEDWTFTMTLLHESGHAVLSMLNAGRNIPRHEMASISHTTSALTDRGTAFDEGFAIHLETLAVQLLDDADIRDRYDHRRFVFGGQQIQNEYHRPIADLLTFSQSRTRYYDVRENNFSFASAFHGADYLRVQLDKSRDFASVRDPNQLLQSEGFYASYFFGYLMRGSTPPTPALLRQRQEKMLATLAELFRRERTDGETPFLLRFVETFALKYPAEAGEVVDVLLDLSHGVFVDSSAAASWRSHYLGALRLDMAERKNEALDAARRRWHDAALAGPVVLEARLAPQLRCEVPDRTVTLIAFGEVVPLSFDINTADEGILRLIPGITGEQVAAWIAVREHHGFTSVEDFRMRAALPESILAKLRFGDTSASPDG